MSFGIFDVLMASNPITLPTYLATRLVASDQVDQVNDNFNNGVATAFARANNNPDGTLNPDLLMMNTMFPMAAPLSMMFGNGRTAEEAAAYRSQPQQAYYSSGQSYGPSGNGGPSYNSGAPYAQMTSSSRPLGRNSNIGNELAESPRPYGYPPPQPYANRPPVYYAPSQPGGYGNPNENGNGPDGAPNPYLQGGNGNGGFYTPYGDDDLSSDQGINFYGTR